MVPLPAQVVVEGVEGLVFSGGTLLQVPTQVCKVVEVVVKGVSVFCCAAAALARRQHRPRPHTVHQ